MLRDDDEIELDEAAVNAQMAVATRAERQYMVIALIQAVIVVAIACTTFGLVQVNNQSQDAKTRTVPVYIAGFVYAQYVSPSKSPPDPTSAHASEFSLRCMCCVLDAVRARNIVQLGLHMMLNICILAYSILQIPQTKTALSGLDLRRCGNFEHCIGPNSLYNALQGCFIVLPITIGLGSIAFALLIRKLRAQFCWSRYRLVGASWEISRMHRNYQVLVALLKLSVFFGVAFCMAYIILIATKAGHRTDLIMTSIALPLVPLVALTMGWAVRREHKGLMPVCLVVVLAGAAFFIYKLSSMFLPATADLFINTKITLTLFPIFTIVILFVFSALAAFAIPSSIMVSDKFTNKTSLWSFPDSIAARARTQQAEEESDAVKGQRLEL